MFGEIAQQRVVEEFAALITIEAQQGQRQCLLNSLDLIDDTARTFILGCPALSPARVINLWLISLGGGILK